MLKKIMRQTKQNGFTLIIVVLLISLFGLALFVLAAGTRTMILESIGATIEADSSNLLASGMAWVKQNKEELFKQKRGFTFQLNVDDLEIRGASCVITIDEAKSDGVDIAIATSCTKGKRTFERRFRQRLHR